MAKQPKSSGTFADLTFPLHGLDNTNEFEIQRPGTTPVGENVRAFEPLTGRGRGGARPGLSRYIDDLVNGISLIQHLDIVVDPTVDALLETDGPVDDPSTSNQPHGRPRRMPVGQQRRVRRGGSGVRTNRNKPKITLTITADDQTKAAGDLFEFDGTEFTTSGLTGGDSITSVSLSSRGADTDAFPGTYTIAIGQAVGSVTGSTLSKKYRIFYVIGEMEVTEVAPVVTSISPTFGYVVGGQTVTITGSGFNLGSVVKFGDETATVLTVSDTVITCTAPPNDTEEYSVTVTNGDVESNDDQTYKYYEVIVYFETLGNSVTPLTIEYSGTVDFTLNIQSQAVPPSDHPTPRWDGFRTNASIPDSFFPSGATPHTISSFSLDGDRGENVEIITAGVGVISSTDACTIKPVVNISGVWSNIFPFNPNSSVPDSFTF